jgi:Ca-activated chloride channel family protein
MFRFHEPLYLLLLTVPAAWLWLRARRRAAMGASTGAQMAGLPGTLRVTAMKALPWAWALGMALLVLALARPRMGHSYREQVTRGVDIMLVLDCSGSMASEDFKPRNRLWVAKDVVKDFIERRPDDRLGLVVFSGQAFTQCPLTLDHGILLTFVDRVELGMIEDGTAIGNALATAVDRLRRSDAKSRIVVLLTDGQNNRGEVAPLTAAEIAKTFGVKVYTVGVGTRGFAMMPVEDPVFGKRYVQTQVNIDEETLEQVARRTGGRYFRATDAEKLKEIYGTIDQLEKTEVKTRERTDWNDRFAWFLIPGLALLLAVALIDAAYLRRLP